MKGTAFLFTFALAAAGQPSDLANQVKIVHLNRVAKPPTIEDFLKGNVPPGHARINAFRQNARPMEPRRHAKPSPIFPTTTNIYTW